MKKIKYFLIITFILALNINVFALGWSGNTNGSGGYTSSCNTNYYCYNSLGLRISLYVLDGSKVKKIGKSHDYWRDKEEPRDAISTSKMVGFDKDVLNDKKKGIIRTGSDFNVSECDYNGTHCSGTFTNKYKSYITYLSESEWGVAGGRDYRKIDENNKFRTWLDNPENAIFKTLDSYEKLQVAFDFTSSDFSESDFNKNFNNISLIVEPLFSIWVGTSTSLPAGITERGYAYTGTAFDLNVFSNNFGGIALYSNTIYVTGTVGNFVKAGGNVLIPVINTDSVDQEYIKGNHAIGMTAYMLNNIIKKKTCHTECDSQPDYMKCAENFCENNSTNDHEKEQCFTLDCNLERPDPATCNSVDCSDKTTNCATQTNYTKTTCSGNDYYKIRCDEQVTLKYANDLPKILGPKIGGINYSLNVAIQNDCTIYYSFNTLKYDYAVLKRNSSQRNTLITEYNNIVSLFKTNNAGPANLPEKLKYKKIEEDNIELKIDGKKIENSKFEIISSDVIKSFINQTASGSIIFYGDTPINNSYKLINDTRYKGSDLYKLNNMCLSFKHSTLNDFCKTRIEELKEYQRYYGYYNEISNIGNVDVELSVSKQYSDGRICKGKDTCYYYVDDKVNNSTCYTEKSGSDEILYITNLGDPQSSSKKITFCYNDSTDDAGSTCYVADETHYVMANRKVPAGKIAYIKYLTSDGSTVKKQCNEVTPKKTCKQKFNPSQTSEISDYCGKNYSKEGYKTVAECITDCTDGKLCKDIFKNKSSNHDAIRDYCNDNYLNNGYETADDCYKKCSNEGPSCKSSVACTNLTAVKSWCTANYAAASYKSKEQCINDCSCFDDSVEYIYRPIALGIDGSKGINSNIRFFAFPNRAAGANWYGYEELTSDADVYKQTPLYVIKFDHETIKKVNDETTSKNIYKEYTDYTNYTAAGGSGIYINMKSNFVEKYKSDIFVCINGDGTDCKNCINEGGC